jgi:SAM-dependent methyltransferase
VKKALLFGCGHRKVKGVQLITDDGPGWEGYELTTLDFNADVNPDVVWDLNNFPYPFADNSFDRIEGHQVLEHIGKQGDHIHFFEEFNQWHRILKPGGLFIASVPGHGSIWQLGDPSHVRVINEGTVGFLDQDAYRECDTSPRTDFRYCYRGDFKVQCQPAGDNFLFILEKK